MATWKELFVTSSVFLVVVGNTTAQEVTTADLLSPQSVNWPGFRGVGARGVAEGFVLPTQWDIESGNAKAGGVLWKVNVPGLGHSSPVIWGNKLFVATAVAAKGKAPLMVGRGGQPTAADDNGTQTWSVICYDKKTGDELWQRVAKRGEPRATRHEKATHANTSVSVDGKHLVAFFGSEGLHCYDLDGNVVWTRDLGRIDISKYGIGWGYASSPAIYRDRILVVCDDPMNPFLAALDISTGDEVWRVSRNEICERSWGTPLIHSAGGTTQVVVNGWPWVVSYDFDSGAELWRIHGGGDNPIPSPFEANGWIYITSAHGAQSPIYVVRPDAKGDLTTATERDEDYRDGDSVLWSTKRGGSYMSTPVVYQDLLYLGNSNGVIRCFHAMTGEKIYERRLPDGAGIIASLVAADGKVYCASENGFVYVLKAGEEFEVVAENAMGGPVLASPAISEGVLYFRSRDSLFAIGKPTK